MGTFLVPHTQYPAAAAIDRNHANSIATFQRIGDLFAIPVNPTKEVPVMLTAHLSALETKHAVLDRRLAEEEHRPMPDPYLVADLKKQKLRLKEEIALAH